MPSYKKITDTSEIKNDVNGFDLIECYKQGTTRIYISFPNLGAGMISQTAISSIPEYSNIKIEEQYVYSPQFAANDDIYVEGKKTRFMPYSGMSREMFVTYVDMTTGCGTAASLGNTINVCIPWKIYSTNEQNVRDYFKTEDENIISTVMAINPPESVPVSFDYYMSTFKMAYDAINGNAGKLEEMLDGIAASIIRYATAGVDLLEKEVELLGEYESLLTQWPPATKWARPYNTSLLQYEQRTNRAEYTDMFTDIRDKDIYCKKIAEGSSNVEITDIFSKPCVLFGVDGTNNRLFYSKELNNAIMEKITLEGSSIPPIVEYNRVINTYGYEGANLVYMNNHDISTVDADLGITLEEFDRLTGSGVNIKLHMESICSDTPEIQALDWSDENAFTGALISSGISLTTMRPPVFSMGEAYLDNYIEEGTMHGRLPFSSSYVLPSDSSGYVDKQYFDTMDFIGYAYYKAEGYDNIVYATGAYISLLKRLENKLISHAPAMYPISDAGLEILKNNKTWRIYTDHMPTFTEGFVSGKPISPSMSNQFIDEFHVTTLPEMTDVRFMEWVPEPNPTDFSDPETGTFDNDSYMAEFEKYLAFATIMTDTKAKSEAYKDNIYLYQGPTSYVDYDYTMYPIMISDEATVIRAQNDETKIVQFRPDKGAGIWKSEDETYSSMSTDPVYMSIPNTGVMNITSILKKKRIAKQYSNYLGNIDDIITSIIDVISTTNRHMSGLILKKVDEIAIPGYKMYPIFENSPCSMTNALRNNYIGNDVKDNLMSVDRYDGTVDIQKTMEDIITRWEASTGALIGRLQADSKKNNGNRIKAYADSIRTSVIEPTRIDCDFIVSKLMIAEGNEYLVYYNNPSNTQRGYIRIPQAMQGYGTWFYNMRKTYLILMSEISLLQSFCDELDNYMVSIINDYSPVIIPMKETDATSGQDNKITTSFDSFAFMNGSSPVYPILTVDLAIADVPALKLNHVTKLSPVNEVFIYRLRIDTAEINDVKDSMAVMMPGFGISNFEEMGSATNRYFWNPASFTTNENETDYPWPDDSTILNAKFTNLQDGISQDDFVLISDGAMKCIDYSGSKSVKSVTPAIIKDAISKTTIDIPEIPAMTIIGKIDAGYIFPFFDAGLSLKSDAQNIDVTYLGMNPVYIVPSHSFNEYITSGKIDKDKLKSAIDRMIGASQERTDTHKMEAVFRSSRDKINTELEKIIKYVKRILSKTYVGKLYTQEDENVDISITTVAHSFLKSVDGYTNNILQGYLFEPADVSALMTNENMAAEIKGASKWESYLTSGIAGKRNFNIYLSKRRAHYSSELLFLSIIYDQLNSEKIDDTSADADNLSIIKDGYRITFRVIADNNTPPSGIAYKLFNAYGFGGLFFNVNTADNANIKSDIDIAIKSQMKVSNNKDGSSRISWKGPVQAEGNADRVTYEITVNSDGKTGTAQLPESSLIFPVVNTEKIISDAAKVKSNIFPDNIRLLPVNYGVAKTLSIKKVYHPSNVEAAAKKAQQFINNNLDSFRIDSYLDRLWVIIEKL